MADVMNPATTPSLQLDGNRDTETVNDENVAPRKPGPVGTDTENITVFHDPENFNVKHPLQSQWTLWFTKPSTGKDINWNELLKKVITFDSVEEFWGIYNNISAASQLAQKSDYHLFKVGIRPEWEDAQNKHGGKWSYQFRDKKGVDIDELWLHTQLAAIGETLEEDGDNEVMGVVINVRKSFFRIGLWTRTVGKGKGRDGAGSEALMKIGQRLKETLKLPPNELVEFSGHTDSAHAGSTRAKAKHSV